MKGYNGYKRKASNLHAATLIFFGRLSLPLRNRVGETVHETVGHAAQVLPGKFLRQKFLHLLRSCPPSRPATPAAALVIVLDEAGAVGLDDMVTFQ